MNEKDITVIDSKILTDQEVNQVSRLKHTNTINKQWYSCIQL